LNALSELRESGVKGHPGAMSLELKAQQQSGNWDEVLNLLDKLERRESIDAITAEQLRQQAWLEKIRQQEDLAGLTACLKNIPADIKRRRKIAATAASMLLRYGGDPLAGQLLAASLDSQWDSELVALYGDCHSGDVVAQIEQAEKWLKLHKQDAGLLLALGKLCLYQKLWGKARSYLDASISIAPSHAAYSALGRLAERLGRSDEASRYYQSAITSGKG
jgi:HemY protein